MEIRIQETGQVVQEREFRDYAIAKAAAAGNQLALPDKLTADMIASHGGDPVLEAPAPTVGEFQSAQRNGVTRDALGNWVQAWTVIDWTQAQIDAYKAERNARLMSNIVDATQQRLDDFAKTRNYDGILSLCTYSSSPTLRFAREGQYGVEARDATWAKLYAMLDEINNGTRPVPSTFADIEPELPSLEWPA